MELCSKNSYVEMMAVSSDNLKYSGDDCLSSIRDRLERGDHLHKGEEYNDCYIFLKQKLAKLRGCVSSVHFAKYTLEKYTLEIKVLKLLVIALEKNIARTSRGQWGRSVTVLRHSGNLKL